MKLIVVEKCRPANALYDFAARDFGVANGGWWAEVDFCLSNGVYFVYTPDIKYPD